jgi:hypothetical protein
MWRSRACSRERGRVEVGSHHSKIIHPFINWHSDSPHGTFSHGIFLHSCGLIAEASGGYSFQHAAFITMGCTLDDDASFLELRMR